MSRLIAWGRSLKEFLFKFLTFLWNLLLASIIFLLGILSHSLVHFIWRGIFIHFFWEELVLGLYLGYGERPGRVLFVAIVILLGAALAYWLGGNFVLDPKASPPLTGHPEIQDAMYYSLVSFVALGYGSWALQPVGWSQWVGAIESVLGIFSVVFFSITFAQRITR